MALTQADSPRWSRLELASTAAAGGIGLAAFVAWARIARAPLVDLALFRNRTYSAVNMATLTFGIAFAMMFFAFYAFMTGVWHYSLPLAGLAITPGPLLVIPTAIITGRIAGRIGHRPVLVAGSMIYGLSGLWFLTVPGPEPAYIASWLPGLMLSGIGVGMVLPSLSGAAVARLPAAHYAVGSAVNQATRQIGSVLGVAITVLLVGHAGVMKADFNPLYGLHIGLALMTGLLCLVVNTRPAPKPA
jgi:MFS family permease